MNWYLTKIVFNIAAENNSRQFDEQLRLVAAESKEEAFLKARTIGLREEDSFYNDKMKEVKWEFINVSEIIAINKLEDGTELYSRIHETDEATSYINFVHQKAIALRKNSRLFY
ncbi:MAG: DUF4288 domain-containing protein [Chitinophagaceae bacterium]|nr:DUF4288 domain-containing protein [Chitinophagaceae bacterium]